MIQDHSNIHGLENWTLLKKLESLQPQEPCYYSSYDIEPAASIVIDLKLKVSVVQKLDASELFKRVFFSDTTFKV